MLGGESLAVIGGHDPCPERRRVGRLDLDAAGPSAIGLGQEKPQDAILQLGRDSFAIDLVAEDERPVIITQAILFVNEPAPLRAGGSILA